MTKLMFEAIEALRALPDEQQDDIANAVLRLAGRSDDATYVLTSEEQADLDEADREIERGEFTSGDELKAIWAKHGLRDPRLHRRAKSWRCEKCPHPVGRDHSSQEGHPMAGQSTNRQGVRRLVMSPYPYIVFYRLKGSDVIIQRVRHAARKPL